MSNTWGYYPEAHRWIPDWDVRVGDGAEQYHIQNVHPAADCAGRVCIIHNPTDHKMRTWPLLWRDDVGLWERLDKFSCGHPDPDQLAYWEATGQLHKSIHGCTGECV